MHVSKDQRRLALDGSGEDIRSIPEVVAASIALGATEVGGPLSHAEERLLRTLPGGLSLNLEALQRAIKTSQDPLGNAIERLRPPEEKRETGAFFTPWPIVASMTAWILDQSPVRVIDPGCGSGRFAAQVSIGDPEVEIIAVDLDPVATLATRATLAVLGANHARVLNTDYTRLKLQGCEGRTAFVGNPPYVRHHTLSRNQKHWISKAAEKLGLSTSGLGLAGLHVHFFLASALLAREGDVGCFITSAEWLDVRYGEALRTALLNGLGALSVHLIDPNLLTFEGAMTTALITCFQSGSSSRSLMVERIQDPRALSSLNESGRRVSVVRLAEAQRWGPVLNGEPEKSSEGTVRLGELVRVSRGSVTGANWFFVLSNDQVADLGLEPWTVPVLSSAAEVLDADGVVRADGTRKMLLDPGKDIDLADARNEALRCYLSSGEDLEVPEGYICSHRNPWWKIGAKRPPIVATYMARQPPAFALNPDGLATLNVLHGLFPKGPLDDEQLAGLVCYLNSNRETFRGSGRTYQGGLEKFEPKEMEALLVPPASELRAYAPR